MSKKYTHIIEYESEIINMINQGKIHFPANPLSNIGS